MSALLVGPDGNPTGDNGGVRQLTPSEAPGWTLLALTAAVAATLGGVVGGVVVHSADGSASPSGARVVQIGALPGSSQVSRNLGSVASVAAKILPSVVSIEVDTPDGGGDTGSGIVISKSGYILTNNHVVAALSTGGTLSVVLPDKQRVRGHIVGHPDRFSDLAVLRVDGVRGLTPAALGASSSLAVGDSVLAVGSPLGLAGTVTEGIVSALDRPVDAGSGNGNPDDVIDAIQTDAAINPGNSGGPLVDLHGTVVGVNSAIATLSGADVFGGTSQGGNIGVGFAIPIDQARRSAEQIISQGYATHAVIGVRLDPSYAGQGARIGSGGTGAAVTAGGPAARAGLRAGDVITAVDGVVVADALDLVVAIRKHTPGQRLQITFRRSRQPHTVTVVLGSARSD
jgi:putative serine protease PepD